MAWSTEEKSIFAVRIKEYFPKLTALQAEAIAGTVEEYSIGEAIAALGEYWKWKNQDEAPSPSGLLDLVRRNLSYATQNFKPDSIDRSGPRMTFQQFAAKQKKERPEYYREKIAPLIKEGFFKGPEIEEWLAKLELMDARELKRIERQAAPSHPVKRLPELQAALKTLLEGVQ